MSDPATAQGDELLDGMLGDFFDESAQLLERLNEHLLRLDAWVRQIDEPASACFDAEVINEMFRAAHSLKGLSAMLGLSEINNLTHRVENVFDAARNRQLPMTPDAVELLFQSTDCLVALIECMKEPQQPAVDSEPVQRGIDELLQRAGAQRGPASQAEAEQALAELAAVSRPAPASDSAPQRAGRPVVDFLEGIVDEADIPAKYLAIFIDETILSLEQLNEMLLGAESAAGTDVVESLLITSHRIKGSAAAVGLNRVAKLAHVMEDVLQTLHDEGRSPTPELVDLLLHCTDALRTYAEELKTTTPRSDCFNDLCHRLVASQGPSPDSAEAASGPQAAGDDAPSPPRSANDMLLTPELLRRVAQSASSRDRAHVLLIAFQRGFPLLGLKAQLVYEKAFRMGEVFFCEPPAEELSELDELECLTLGISSEHDESTIESQLCVAGVERVMLVALDRANELLRSDAFVDSSTAAALPEEPTATDVRLTSPSSRDAGSPTPAPSVSSTARTTRDSDGGGARHAETIRVDIERLDQLMSLVGQLVISKARLTQIGDGLRQVTLGKEVAQQLDDLGRLLEKICDTTSARDGRPAANLDHIAQQARRMKADLIAVRRSVDRCLAARGRLNDFHEAIHQLDRVADGIQKSVMDTRMVPIGPLFGRFRRVIRDITRTSGKEIQLVIRGEKTELDKRMIDELGDPLIHMVRNSADHGIEPPDERLAAGKSRTGTVTLDAFHRGNSIIIQVTDDGRGIDAEKVKAKALAKGLLTAADAEKMTPHQIYQLIWEPGFSTAERVTDISGRGMGMDIVKSKVEELNGAVELDSTPGEGTVFTIKLPLTMAILPSLLAEIDGDVFALPIESVIEIVRVERGDLQTVHGQRTARVRGRVISLVHLRDVFHWHEQRSADCESHDATLVILGTEGREMGLVVDRLLGEEDVVIKSLAENYQNVEGIAGASILGDGRVSLILDTGALIDMASQALGQQVSNQETFT